MKLEELIKEEWLYRKQYALFNLETNWHVIHRNQVFRLSRIKDQAFFQYEDGTFDWVFAEKHIKRTLEDPEQFVLAGDYKDFEIEEDVDFVYIDGEKITLK